MSEVTSPSEIDHITDSLSQERDETVYTCRNGLRLRIKKINGRIYVDAAQKLTRPKVPTVWLEDKQREEENPNHPDYIAAVSQYSLDQEEIAFNISFALGVDVLTVPEGLESIDSHVWSDELREAWSLSGIEIDIALSGMRRKVAWLKYYAMPMEDDQAEVLTRVMSMGGGVVAAHVEQALTTFRSPEERLADHGIHVIE